MTVKLETFPFTKNGTLNGTVSFVAQDAVDDEKRGLIFMTRVRLNDSSIKVGDRTVNLSPGMATTAEIKIAERRVIEYFLSPVLETTSEGLRER